MIRTTEEAKRLYPLLMLALRKKTIPEIYCLLGQDAAGRDWECINLRQYAHYALRAFLGEEPPEPEATTLFRMDLTQKAVIRHEGS